MHAKGRVWRGGLPLPSTEVQGCHFRKIFENIGANLSNLVYFWRPVQQKCTIQWLSRILGDQFDDIRSSKVARKSTLFHATFKSGMEFTIPAI